MSTSPPRRDRRVPRLTFEEWTALDHAAHVTLPDTVVRVRAAETRCGSLLAINAEQLSRLNHQDLQLADLRAQVEALTARVLQLNAAAGRAQIERAAAVAPLDPMPSPPAEPEPKFVRSEIPQPAIGPARPSIPQPRFAAGAPKVDAASPRTREQAGPPARKG